MGDFIPLPNLGSKSKPPWHNGGLRLPRLGNPRSLHHHPLGHAAYGTTKVAVRAIFKPFSPHATYIGSYYPFVVCYNIGTWLLCMPNFRGWME
jgi:hypothetical protein